MGRRIAELIAHFHGAGHGARAEFAKNIHVARSQVTSWLSGLHLPSAETRLRICLYYRVRRAWLDRGTGLMIDVPPAQADTPCRECLRILRRIERLLASPSHRRG